MQRSIILEQLKNFIFYKGGIENFKLANCYEKTPPHDKLICCITYHKHIEPLLFVIPKIYLHTTIRKLHFIRQGKFLTRKELGAVNKFYYIPYEELLNEHS